MAARHDSTTTMPWTDERSAMALQLAQDGLDPREISKRLGGVTRAAVLGKLHRMGFRLSPVMMAERRAQRSKALARLRPPKEKRPPKPRKKRGGNIVSTGFASADEDRRSPQLDCIARMAEPERKGVHISTLTFRQCRWPVNDAQKGEEHLFCGDETELGRSYCKHHAGRAYRENPFGIEQ